MASHVQETTITSQKHDISELGNTYQASSACTHLSCLWTEADAVCFDVDSTVTQEEGIDKLAERAGKGEEVARLTKQAMGGDMSFRRALDLRLNAIQPTKDFVQKVAAEPVPLTPGIDQLVRRLHALGKKVFLVSGGFRSMIQPVAEQLGIQSDHIFANELLFDETGTYAGFDHDEPTSDSGGKARAVTEIMRRFNVSKVVMVGDGATDMEAKPPAQLTVGFGGNVVREKVKALADLYVYDFQMLISMLESSPVRNPYRRPTPISGSTIRPAKMRRVTNSDDVSTSDDSLSDAPGSSEDDSTPACSPQLDSDVDSCDEHARLWLKADAVCFDVDSTVTQEEGIDKLAERAGKGEEVARVTKQAMGGDMSFRRALDLRLNAIQPTKDFVQRVAAEPVPLTPGIDQLVRRLHALGKKVFLVSGGFRSMIQPVAEQLGIQSDHIFANELLFDETGGYAGFDHDEPTSDSGGKARAVTEIMRRFHVSKVVMVGDGATDMEAKPPARLTVGFGGNVVREKVKALADLYVYDFQVLISMLENAQKPRS